MDLQTPVLQKVISSIKIYKTLLQEQGYSNSKISTLLYSLLQPTATPTTDLTPIDNEKLISLIKLYLSKHSSIQRALTELLVSIEVEISVLKETSDHEDAGRPSVSKKNSQEKGKEEKKKQDKKKKKTKTNKNKAIEEVKTRALMEMQRQRDGLKQNMEQIRLLKNFLDNKMMSQMCFQSMPSLNPSSIFSM